MANLCAGICSSLLVEKGAGYRGFARHRLRSTPRVGWQHSRGIGGSFAVESVAAFVWNRWQACYGINGSFGVEQVAALPWNRWQDSPGIGGSFGVEYALCPRLSHLRDRRLHVPRDIAVPAALHPVVDPDVSLSQVEASWDHLIRVTASIEGGWLSAVLALTRFGAAARADPIHKAGNALGKLLRSLFLCDYLSNEGFRREILRILNRGESVHTLQRIIHSGSIAAARGRRHEEPLAISGSLTLLTNMVMAWTTQRMQQVLDRWQRTRTRRVEPDLLRHIGPMHFQNINFRGEMAFPLARYRSRLIPGLSAKTGHETHGTDGS